MWGGGGPTFSPAGAGRAAAGGCLAMQGAAGGAPLLPVTIRGEGPGRGMRGRDNLPRSTPPGRKLPPFPPRPSSGPSGHLLPVRTGRREGRTPQPRVIPAQRRQPRRAGPIGPTIVEHGPSPASPLRIPLRDAARQPKTRTGPRSTTFFQWVPALRGCRRLAGMTPRRARRGGRCSPSPRHYTGRRSRQGDEGVSGRFAAGELKGPVAFQRRRTPGAQATGRATCGG